MKQLRNAAYSSKNVTPKLDDLKQESKMVVACRSSHTLLQDEFLSHKLVEKNKHIGSFLVIFLMLSMLMLSTWMVVDSVRCERVQVANNMLSVAMVIMQLIMMRHVHMTEFKDKGKVGRPIPHLMYG
jgi:ABC-type Na+ efflux pump permease subunit